MTWLVFFTLIGLNWLAMITHFFAWEVAAKEGHAALRWFFLAAAKFPALAITVAANTGR